MLQCLEWEPTGSYQIAVKELTENGTMSDQSGPSGLIDIHLSTEISDGNLPSNPQKAIIYHPTVSHLIAVGIFSIFFASPLKLKFCISVRGTSNTGIIS
jgi:hypothetical protein